ncbi:MAG TPA: class I SAM-dependent methyltransferase [Planctomycetota bacterium]|nr:class I SAM-dependent methyltransferase [Planctomycetota bacterium]
MPASRGVVYVAFGTEYAKVAAASAQSVERHCKLPIHVIHNVDVGKYAWPAGTTFDFHEAPDEDNRSFRMTLVNRTPFQRTLLLDADCLVNSPHVALPFDYLDRFDMCPVAYRPLREYRRGKAWQGVRRMLGCDENYVYSGGVLWFCKNTRVQRFFSLWRRFWIADGRGRDMPAMIRALWGSDVRFWPLVGLSGYLGIRDGHILHEVGCTPRGLPDMQYKLRPPEAPGGEWRRVRTRSDIEPADVPMRPSIREVAKRFARLGKGTIRGAEIGVWKGDHAADLLAALRPKQLLLVDPWNAYDIDGEYGEWMRRVRGEDAFRRWTARDWETLHRSVCDRFADSLAVQIHRRESSEADSICAPESLHFAYIDGNHTYQYALNDLSRWWTRIMPGGVLCGHDYDAETQPEVVRAAHVFAEGVAQPLYHEGNDFWIFRP